MKTFYTQYNIGKAKYIVCFADGIKKHLDGSLFFDIAIFKNAHLFKSFTQKLIENGYNQKN